MTRLATSLEDVQTFVQNYVVVTHDQAVALALWVAHTHAFDAADTTPYLAVTSPEKQSGKTLLLDVLEPLVNEPWRVIRPSEPVLFRQIEKKCPTLLMDEVDTIWGPKARSEDEGLRALLNAGFRRRGSTIPRCVGPSLKLRDFRTYCPKALAGIGDLPDTIADRSIPIRMQRKRRDDNVARWRWRDVEHIAAAVRESIQSAVSAVSADLSTTSTVDLPDTLSDRAQDAWEPLLAIADLASGDWPTTARTAATNLMDDRVEEIPIGARLLTDIRASFNGDARLSSAELLEHLANIEDSPWSDWGGKPITGRRLANLLRPYGIHPHNENGWRGYFKNDFTNAWDRYTPSPPNALTALNALEAHE